MHFLGKIDRELYKCITDEISTDEVILTNERIKHIISRRGQNFYNRYKKEFIFILQNPDYIFYDKINTALVCKRLSIENKYINIVIRFAVSTESSTYKNSIITVIEESEKRFQQRLRNHIPLYKK